MLTPCRTQPWHQGEPPHHCRPCASEDLAPEHAHRIVITEDPDRCRRGHRGQTDGSCSQCAGLAKGRTPDPPRATPGVAHRPGTCEHGLKIRWLTDGRLGCPFCRRATE